MRELLEQLSALEEYALVYDESSDAAYLLEKQDVNNFVKTLFSLVEQGFDDQQIISDIGIPTAHGDIFEITRNFGVDLDDGEVVMFDDFDLVIVPITGREKEKLPLRVTSKTDLQQLANWANKE